MPFIPHTGQDVREMLDSMGVENITDLFSDIPLSLRTGALPSLPASLNEMSLARLAKTRAAMDQRALCFIGAGAYEHHIPAAVWDIASRGEWMTGYTPYQAEASQGTLQLLYEHQSMMAHLMGMEVANAGLYDGASALAEALMMVIRLMQKKKGRQRENTKPSLILLPATLHPHYRAVVKTFLQQQGIELACIPHHPETGCTDLNALAGFADRAVTALVIPQPNFFGSLEAVDALTDWAHERGALAVAVVNPLAMALFRPPGQWGKQGADLACGDGQPLGIPLFSGGPYYGFLCCRKAFLRELPGRLAGETTDQRTGKQRGFVLTLQAREQHIRRARATSNICTSQGLAMTASTIYMSLLGPQGLRQVATCCHERMLAASQALKVLPGIEAVFAGPFFHEQVLRSNQPLAPLLQFLESRGIQAGFSLENWYPELKNCFLTCATETKTAEDISLFATVFQEALHPAMTEKHAHV